MKKEATLKETEYHPSADSAMEWYNEWKKDFKRYCQMKESMASTALSGNRLPEIMLSTMDRLEKGEPISDRYLLGLCWFLRDGMEYCQKQSFLEEIDKALKEVKGGGNGKRLFIQLREKIIK